MKEAPKASTLIGQQSTLHSFVINLKDATERWDHMTQALEKVGLDYTRIDAVLGKMLTEPISAFDERRFNIVDWQTQNYGEIGCYLSHIKALNTFIKSDFKYALILEDDVELPRFISPSLDSCSHPEQPTLGYAFETELFCSCFS